MDLLERTHLLGELAGILTEAAAGSGRMVMLGGEAGVGKTAVVDRFCAEASHRPRVLRGACDPLGTPRPLGPVIDIAAATGGRLEAALGEHASRDQVFTTFLAELGRPGAPTLVVFEDVHWADGATLDLIRFLGRRIGAVPAMLVATYRDDEVGPRHPLRMALGQLATSSAVRRASVSPLSLEAVRELAAGSAIDPVDLFRTTGGNPFFVTEVIAAGGGGRVPASVRDAVLARCGTLSGPALAALEVVALARVPVTPGFVAEVLGGDEAAVLEECITTGVLREADRLVAFRHELARVAVLETVPTTRRPGLHARMLRVLRRGQPAPDDLALLAFHAEESGDGAAVAEYAPAAAQRASALSAHRESAAQYSRTLRAATGLTPDLRANYLEALSYESYVTNHLEEAIAASGAALELRRAAGDRRHEGDDLRWLSRYLWIQGRNAEAEEAGVGAVDILEPLGPSTELASAYCVVSQLAAYVQDKATAQASAGKAVELGQALHDDSVVAHARINASMARMLCDDDGWDDMYSAREVALAGGFEEHAARSVVIAHWIAVLHRDFARADPAAEVAMAYCIDRDLLSYLVFANGAQSLGLLHRGRWDDAAAAASEVVERTTSPMFRILAATVLGLLHARRGSADPWFWLDEAIGFARPDDLLRLCTTYEARAEAAWLAGDHARTRLEAAKALAAATGQTDPWFGGALRVWAVRGGDPDPGGARAAEPFALELAGEWAAAAAFWERRGCPYDAALALLGGDGGAVVRALEVFDSLGARAASKVAGERLRALGIRRTRRGPHAGTRANPFHLTERELEVLALIAEGLTDAEIAERLSLAVKTVGHHVGSVLSKMGVHSRRQAAGAWRAMAPVAIEK
jgi:DNA-binding CsgD family transcriptional regulator